MREAEARGVLSSLAQKAPELIRLQLAEQPIPHGFFEESAIQFHMNSQRWMQPDHTPCGEVAMCRCGSVLADLLSCIPVRVNNIFRNEHIVQDIVEKFRVEGKRRVCRLKPAPQRNSTAMRLPIETVLPYQSLPRRVLLLANDRLEQPARDKKVLGVL